MRCHTIIFAHIGFEDFGTDNEQPGILFKTFSKSTLSWFLELDELESQILSKKLLLKNKNYITVKKGKKV